MIKTVQFLLVCGILYRFFCYKIFV